MEKNHCSKIIGHHITERSVIKPT